MWTLFLKNIHQPELICFWVKILLQTCPRISLHQYFYKNTPVAAVCSFFKIVLVENVSESFFGEEEGCWRLRQLAAMLHRDPLCRRRYWIVFGCAHHWPFGCRLPKEVEDWFWNLPITKHLHVHRRAIQYAFVYALPLSSWNYQSQREAIEVIIRSDLRDKRLN